MTINETFKFVHTPKLIMLAEINSLTILIYNYPSFNVTNKPESSNFTLLNKSRVGKSKT